ncbi:alkaline phosphatase 4-like [Osmia bicornis bicornis]|uniref:alkaline phosphatase 4-like n=1 Tax=Osmia bicornis bicornis TaxID=1437191 RepID=UPI0010F655E5|nr:alkaline phosphatase 4-like [Osmia bicornis bicornis]XP_029034186.1 alkaline phosphatase 4-like [Osmia bicornis bicornis]
MKQPTVLISALLGLFAISDALPRDSNNYEDMSFWLKSGQEDLRRNLAYRNNENRAKNVIVFIGDGMGISTITAGRIFKGQTKGATGEEYKLAFEQFPNTGFAKTYNTDKQVPDSAGTATAIFSGVKCRYRMIGLDAKASYNHCDKRVDQESKLTTVADWAQQSGMSTGFVTTTRITHATPAGLYAHTNNRDWECDTSIPKQYKDCVKDIARQLIEDAPGNKFQVMMGGGAQHMGLPLEPVDPETCVREDGLNLAEVWTKNNPEGNLVTNAEQLMSLDVANVSKILGIFATSHLPYHAVKPVEVPSLANMTAQAIKLLNKNKNGFFLMVESGKIDLAHHRNYAKLALREVSELEEAVLTALQQVKLEETLVIVTADHSHAFTINGYPNRGNDILGFANDPNKVDMPAYETLNYANGPGFFHHRRNDSTNVNDTWRPVDQDETRNEPFYMQMAAIYMKDETHGGEDVGVYAIGPYSHLFRGTFEQNYIAHVIAYAACFKDWPSHCDNTYDRYFYKLTNSVDRITISPFFLSFLSFAFILIVARN